VSHVDPGRHRCARPPVDETRRVELRDGLRERIRFAALVLTALLAGDSRADDEAAEEARRLGRELAARGPRQPARRPLVLSAQRERGEDPPAEVRGADTVSGVPGPEDDFRASTETCEEGEAVERVVDRATPAARRSDVGEHRVEAVKVCRDLNGARGAAMERLAYTPCERERAAAFPE